MGVGLAVAVLLDATVDPRRATAGVDEALGRLELVAAGCARVAAQASSPRPGRPPRPPDQPAPKPADVPRRPPLGGRRWWLSSPGWSRNRWSAARPSWRRSTACSTASTRGRREVPHGRGRARASARRGCSTELRRRGEEAGTSSLQGVASEFERDLPFGVCVDALDAYLASLDGPSPAGPPSCGPSSGGVFPSLRRAAAGGARRAQRRALPRASRDARAARALAERKPLVLVLDDLHWADDASLELLAGAAAPRPPTARSCSSWPSAPARRPPARRPRSRRRRCERIALGAAQRGGGGGAARPSSIAGRAWPRSTATAAATRSTSSSWPAPAAPAAGRGGRGADAAASPPASPRRWPRSSPRSPTTRAGAARRRRGRRRAVRARPRGRGRRAAPTTWRSARSTSCSRGTSSARPSVPRRFVFRHPLVRRAVYESTPGGWRLAAHERAAAALAERGAAAGRARPPRRAGGAPGRRGGDRAAARGGRGRAPRAPAVAARWFDAALRLLPDDDTERQIDVRRRARLGAALARRARAMPRRRCSRRSSSSPPTPTARRVELTTRCAAVEHWLGRHDEAHGRLTRAWEELPDRGTRRGARPSRSSWRSTGSTGSTSSDASRWAPARWRPPAPLGDAAAARGGRRRALPGRGGGGPDRRRARAPRGGAWRARARSATRSSRRTSTPSTTSAGPRTTSSTTTTRSRTSIAASTIARGDRRGAACSCRCCWSRATRSRCRGGSTRRPRSARRGRGRAALRHRPLPLLGALRARLGALLPGRARRTRSRRARRAASSASDMSAARCPPPAAAPAGCSPCALFELRRDRAGVETDAGARRRGDRGSDAGRAPLRLGDPRPGRARRRRPEAAEGTTSARRGGRCGVELELPPAPRCRARGGADARGRRAAAASRRLASRGAADAIACCRRRGIEAAFARSSLGRALAARVSATGDRRRCARPRPSSTPAAAARARRGAARAAQARRPRRGARAGRGRRPGVAALTGREREIADLVTDRRTNRRSPPSCSSARRPSSHTSATSSSSSAPPRASRSPARSSDLATSPADHRRRRHRFLPWLVPRDPECWLRAGPPRVHQCEQGRSPLRRLPVSAKRSPCPGFRHLLCPPAPALHTAGARLMIVRSMVRIHSELLELSDAWRSRSRARTFGHFAADGSSLGTSTWTSRRPSKPWGCRTSGFARNAAVPST